MMEEDDTPMNPAATASSEEVQITGLELLETPPDNSGVQHQRPAQQPAQSPTRNDFVALSPKPRSGKAPAMIRNYKKPIPRTKSMPTTAVSRSQSYSQRERTGSGDKKLKKKKSKDRLSPMRTQSQSQSHSQQQPGVGPAGPGSFRVARRGMSMGFVSNASAANWSLPRISRRVSIGNEAVGVTQTHWGQKPQRRTSMQNTSNYQYASHSQLQSPHQQRQYQNQNNNNAHQYHHQQQQQQQQGMDTETDLNNDSFSRRSSLSSHNSDFSDRSLDHSGAIQTGGAYLSNVAHLAAQTGSQQPQKHYQKPITRRWSIDSSFSADDYSYANDSIDVRRKHDHGQHMHSRQYTDDKDDEDSYDVETYAADSIDLRKKKQRQATGTAEDDDDYDSCDGDTYAADSIDLRKKHQQQLHHPNNNDNEDDDYYDSDEDSYGVQSYAADSLDLRRNTQLRHVEPIITAAKPAVPPVAHVEMDDSFASSAYSCAADSLDLRRQKQQLQQQAAQNMPSREDLGYGGGGEHIHSANTKFPPQKMPSQKELGYGVVETTTTTEQTAPSREALGYGSDNNASNSIRKTGNPTLYMGDGDSSTAYSYAADSLDLRKYRAQKIVDSDSEDYSTEDEDDADDNEIDHADDDDMDSNKTPIDYMTRVVMGYSKKTKPTETAPGAAPATTDSDDDEDDDDSDADSNKTPMDYMTQIVMGYSNKNKTNQQPNKKKQQTTSLSAFLGGGGGAAAVSRRQSNESDVSSIYSYACDSVAMKPKRVLRAAPEPKKNVERYDDDSDDSDYSDDDEEDDSSRHGGGGMLGGRNPYLSQTTAQQKHPPPFQTSASFDTGMERQFSCNSFSNDSVHLRKAKKQSKPTKKRDTRRESMDSQTSGISAAAMDPNYLNSVLGYAMDASGISLGNNSSSRRSADFRRTDEDESSYNASASTSHYLMDSVTSMGTDYSDFASSLPPTTRSKAASSAVKDDTLPSLKGMSSMQTSASSLGAFETDTSRSDQDYLGYEDMGMR